MDIYPTFSSFSLAHIFGKLSQVAFQFSMMAHPELEDTLILDQLCIPQKSKQDFYQQYATHTLFSRRGQGK